MLPCWCLAVPQSKLSPLTIAQRCTSKLNTSPDLTLALFLPWPQTGNRVLLASLPIYLLLLSCWPTWAAGAPRASRVGWTPAYLPPSTEGRKQKGILIACLPCPSGGHKCIFLILGSSPSHLSFFTPTFPLPRVFVPSFTYRVSAQLVCVGSRGVLACPLTLRLRPKAPPLHNSSSVSCGGASVCQLELALPPWGHWVYVRVEIPSRGPGRTIRFQLCVRLQGQKPHIHLGHSAWVNFCGWEEAVMVVVFIDPLPRPYNLPKPIQAPSHSLKPFHLKF